jgi:hypothetical protein
LHTRRSLVRGVLQNDESAHALGGFGVPHRSISRKTSVA